jgi:lipopolysaccharide biosynthesis glycosyltransferase
MLKVFVGFDERQRVSFTTLATSIYETATRPVLVSPLVLRTLPITRRGLTPFTFSRFLVPWLCEFQGSAVFMDADMLLASDITELVQCINEQKAVSVVRSLEIYEQTSFMLLNCAHPSNRKLTPEFIEKTDINLHGMEWAKEEEIGSLDPKWNQLVGYQDVDFSQGNIHYTMGIPAFPETLSSPGA